MIPESAWQWFGNAAHFVAARDCRFHLSTRIGDVVVSTVGDYHPPCSGRDRDGKPEEIGHGRTFETMVFAVDPTRAPCSEPGCACGMPELDYTRELHMDAYTEAGKAAAGHMEACRRAARGKFA